MNWKLILILPAIAIEAVSALTTGRETGFGNWVMDRRITDPMGKPWHSREQALEVQKAKALTTLKPFRKGQPVSQML